MIRSRVRRHVSADQPDHPVQLEELDRFLRFATERFSEGVYWIAEQGNIVYANRRASQLNGYSFEELTSMKMYDLNVDLDPTSWPGIWALLKAAGEREFEVRHRHRDGRVLLMHVSANFFNLGGKEYSCAFLSDISERKELEGRLRQAEKMEAIGRLAGGVAHDFNNQLAGIMGYAELLRVVTSPSPKAQELVEQLCATVKVAADLTASSWRSRGAAELRPADRSPPPDRRRRHHVLAQRRPPRPRPDRARSHTFVDAPGDPSQLQSALLNLLLNARDAMPEGGTVTVATSNLELAEGGLTPHPIDLEKGDYVVATVHDTGVGMDAEMQARIFEPFFTTKDVGVGTGLGLAAVYGTAKNHKGAIGVRSSPGNGSQFTLYLPVSRAGGARREHSEEPPSLRLHGQVIVIDDERVVRESQAQMLEALGCTVVSFPDADTAIAHFEREHASVDLVLLDLVHAGPVGR